MFRRFKETPAPFVTMAVGLFLAVCLGIGGMLSNPRAASAQSFNNVAQPITPCLITTASVTVCDAGGPAAHSRTFIGAVNTALTAQTATLNCWDPLAGQTSGGAGTIQIAALGATQILIWPAGGRRYTNSWSCQASGAVTAPGIEIYLGP